MKHTVIVGGGWMGLVAAKALKNQGRAFLGLEKGARLGIERGWESFQRYFAKNSIDWLNTEILNQEWDLIGEIAVEKKKGEWKKCEATLSHLQALCTQSNFFRGRTPYNLMMDELVESVRENFTLNHEVHEIDPLKKVVKCGNGIEFEFEKLIWCAGLKPLSRLLGTLPDKTAKALRSLQEPQAALVVDFEFYGQSLPTPNSVILPFRHKDIHTLAIGHDEPTSSTEKLTKQSWITFLNPEVAEDKEEVAKFVRTFKREWSKEFPEMVSKQKKERISFIPHICQTQAIRLPSLELTNSVFYLGYEAAASEEDKNLPAWDRAIMNCKRIIETA